MKMFKNMVFRIRFAVLSFVGFFVWSGVALAVESCPALDCDCASLPKQHWRSVCFKEESKLKRECVANSSQPTGYCLVHGPAAQPLPHAVELGGVTILPESRIDQVDQQNTQGYWSLRSDLGLFKELMQVNAFKEANTLVDSIDRNLDKLFVDQRRITASYETLGKKRKYRSTWSDYADNSLGVAQLFLGLGEDLWKQRSKAGGSASQDKALRVLSLKALRSASKALEMAAYGYNATGADKKAAAVWQDAADASLVMLKHKSVEGAPESHINYYNNQIAVRLFRSGYHWQLAGKSDEAVRALRDSQKYYQDKKYLIGSLLSGDGNTAVAEN